MLSTRKFLNEEDKIQIWVLYNQLGSRWVQIGLKVNQNANTVRSFVNRYKKSHVLSPKKGPPFRITQEDKQFVVDLIEADPENTLLDLQISTKISTSSCKTILNKKGFIYTSLIPMCRLTQQHKINRVNFANYFAHLPLGYARPIIFSDESTICININKRGIWRKRGFYPEEGFYIKESKPKSIMIWGAIGPYGWRSKLVRVQGHVNSQKYIQILDNSNTIQYIANVWNGNCFFQQDNAPSHVSAYTRSELVRRFRFLLTWPAKSPDLSPIEQIWSWIKRELAGKTFRTEEELFDAVEALWNSMPNDFVDEFYRSFQARCIVCMQHNGESLNGKWSKVKRIHNQYRNNQPFYF